MRRRAVNQQPPAVVTDFTGYPVRKEVVPIVIPMESARPIALQVSMLVCLTWDDMKATQCQSVPAWSSPRLSFDPPKALDGQPYLREGLKRSITLAYTDQFTGKVLRREHGWLVARTIDLAPHPVYLMGFERPVDFR